MKRFRRTFCAILTMLISFTLLCELAPMDSGAASFSGSVIDEDLASDGLFDEEATAGGLVDEAKKKNTKKKTPTTVPYTNPEGAELSYRVLTEKGWDKDYTAQGKVAGKPGSGLGIRAVEIGINSDIEGKVCCRAYLEDTGWTGQAGNFETAGSEKGKKSLQKIKIYLTEKLLVKYRIFYRISLDSYGWLGWCCDGFVTGNEDYDRAVDAIQIVLAEREKGDVKIPNINGVVSKTSAYYKDASKIKAYMIKKAQKYTSKTKYLVLIDSQYCFLGVFKGKKNHWSLIRFYLCAPGIYKTYWNRDHELGVKSKGFYSYNCQVYWATRLKKELWIHSITYKGHNGKKVLDGRLGARISHGCIRLATENAKWIYDNVPSYSRCIIYKKKFL